MSICYICRMNLLGEISEFTAKSGIECTTGSFCGHEILRTDNGTVIFPVSISATSIDQASEQAERLREALQLHLQKTGNYPLIITEDRWRSQNVMIQARLLAHLQVFTQIYARNCEIRKIDKSTAAEFLTANHSYGDASCRHRYGLYLKRHTGHNAGSVPIAPGTLVAVATFSNARKWIKGDKAIRSYEWTRYASLPGIRLSGGMGKLLKAFIKEVNPDDIMTYADLEWSEGKVYETLGFVLEGIKEPVTFTTDPEGWKRKALATDDKTSSGKIYFKNMGSNKYRLKLTYYQ